VRRKVASLVKHASKTNKQIALNHYSTKNPKITTQQLEKLQSVFEELGYRSWISIPPQSFQVLYYIHQLPDSHEKNRLIYSVLPDYLLNISKDPGITRDQTIDMALVLSDKNVHVLGEKTQSPVPALSDLRDQAEAFLIKARDHQVTNLLILDRHLIQLPGYGAETIKKLKDKVGFSKLTPGQQNEFMFVIAALVAISDVNEQKRALDVFKAILKLNYGVPVRTRDPNNIHQIVNILTARGSGLIDLSRVSLDKVYDPVQMHRAVALLTHFQTLPDRGLVLLNDTGRMTDVIYVLLNGDIYDPTGDVRVAADKILKNYASWKYEVADLKLIAKSKLTDVDRAKLMLAEDESYNINLLPQLISLLSGKFGDNWRGVAGYWLSKHRNDGKAYEYHVLQNLFSALAELKRMNFEPERVEALLTDSYQAFERRVLKFVQEFYNKNKQVGQTVRIQNLYNELGSQFSEILKSSQGEKYIKSFKDLNNEHVDQFISLAERDKSLFELAHLIHLLNSIDKEKQHITDRLFVLINQLEKHKNPRLTPDFAKRIVGEMASADLMILGAETLSPELRIKTREVLRTPTSSMHQSQEIMNAIRWFYFNGVEIEKELAKKFYLRHQMDLPKIVVLKENDPMKWAQNFLDSNDSDPNGIVHQAITVIAATSNHPYQAKAKNFLNNQEVSKSRPPVHLNNAIESPFYLKRWTFDGNKEAVRLWNEQVGQPIFKDLVGKECWHAIQSQNAGNTSNLLITSNYRTYQNVYALCGQFYNWKNYRSLDISAKKNET
jgi:hypothetical protein